MHPIDRLAGLSGAAAARGYSWGQRVFETLRARHRCLPPCPSWQSPRVPAIAGRLVNDLTSDADDAHALARLCAAEAERRYERLRAGTVGGTSSSKIPAGEE